VKVRNLFYNGLAAARGLEALVGLLLDHVARLDLHTYEEEPLDLAAEGGYLATAKTLLRRGTPIPSLSGIIRSIYWRKLLVPKQRFFTSST
jgi:hypothetical protein